MQDREKGAKCNTFLSLFSTNLKICPVSCEALKSQFCKTQI